VALNATKKRDHQQPQRRYRPEETRAMILNAARELFQSQGYTQTSSAEIATRAGVAEGSLFYHFGSKKNLMAALGEAYGRDKVNAMRRGEEDLSRLEPGVIITRAFEYSCHNGFVTEATGLDMTSPEIQPFMNAGRKVIVAFITRCIRASRPQNTHRRHSPQSAEIAASFSYAVVADALHHLHTSAEPVSRDALLKETIRYVRAACGYDHIIDVPSLDTPEEKSL